MSKSARSLQASQKAAELGGSWRWLVLGAVGGTVLSQVSIPHDWGGWWWVATLGLAVAGAIGGKVVPWVYYWFASVDHSKYQARATVRKLVLDKKSAEAKAVKIEAEHQEKAKAALKMLEQVVELVQAPRQSPLEEWHASMSPRVMDAVTTLSFPALGVQGGVSIGNVLKSLAVDAGSVGITHWDLRMRIRALGEEPTGNESVVCMQYLVAEGVLAPKDGTYTHGSTCMLTDHGRTALSAFARCPPEFNELFKRKRENDTPQAETP